MEEHASMSILWLYSADDSKNDYNHNGYGALDEVTTLLSNGKINGEVILTGMCPINAHNAQYVVNENIIRTKINDTQEPQIMRLFNVKKSMSSGLITFEAEPIANDLRKYYITKYFASGQENPMSAFTSLSNVTVPKMDSHFTFFSNKTDKAQLKIEKVNLLEALGGVEGSMLQRYKGEYEKDNHTIKLLKRLGEDHKIKILYTKNLTGLDVEVDTQGIWNGVYPYAKKEESEEIIELPEKILLFKKTFAGGSIKEVDFSDRKPKNAAELKKTAMDYMTSNAKNNEPKVGATIDFILLNNQRGYEEFVNMERVGLGDGVDVYHKGLDVNLHARVVEYEYDCLTEQYTKLVIGQVKADFTHQINDRIDDNKKQTDESIDDLEKATKEASDIINLPGKGHVVVYPSLSKPQEILIMDTKDVNTARKVWRWNEGGLGFSSNGYKGPYGLAMTNNGSIVADRMTTGILRAIQLLGKNLSIDLSSGVVKFKHGYIEGGDGRIRLDMDSSYLHCLDQSNNGFELENGELVFYESFLSNKKKEIARFLLDILSDGQKGMMITSPSSININASKCSLSIGGGLLSKKGTNEIGGPIDIWGKTTIIGDFSVLLGKKNAVHPTTKGLLETPAYETTESYLGDIGEAVTDEQGQIKIKIESIFSQIINTSIAYQVFVSPYGNAKIWVSEKNEDYFMVKSDQPNVKFCWELKARRRGYENDRLKDSGLSFEMLDKAHEQGEI